MRTIMEVGECIAKKRNEEGLTQEMLAEKIGCEANTLSRWECGTTTMKIDSLQNIACALDVSADYLLGIEGKQDKLSDLVVGLTESQRLIVESTISSLIKALKSQQN